MESNASLMEFRIRLYFCTYGVVDDGPVHRFENLAGRDLALIGHGIFHGRVIFLESPPSYLLVRLNRPRALIFESKPKRVQGSNSNGQPRMASVFFENSNLFAVDMDRDDASPNAHMKSIYLKGISSTHTRLDKPQQGTLIDYMSKTMLDPSILNLSTLS